jgi:D-ribose pyranose/furanose isomerase RbsD
MEVQKTTLHEIVSKVSDITAQIVEANGEISPDVENQLIEIDLSLARKIDSYSVVMERLESEADYWDKKAKMMKAIADSHYKLREKLRERIKEAMIAMEKTEIRGSDVRFKLCKTQPRLVVNEGELPLNYKRVVLEIDKEKIKADLKNQVEVPGASLQESFALRTFANRE